ncbi:MAG: glycosyltransferase family 39 protein [Alphaproteobacteria bacterium]|nr:glycosyltransferase family 39 protein [Alphaproteobacteria bacterium]
MNGTTTLPFGLCDGKGGRLSPLGYAALLFLCIVLYLPGFFTLPPTDRDESRFAQATKQMIESGNYTDIRYQDEARYQKPAGIYWLQAASVTLLSPGNLTNIWAYRIPSLLGVIAAVMLLAFFAARLIGARGGLAAGAIFACCFLIGVEARQAKTDAVLMLCITASQLLLMHAYTAHRAGKPVSLPAALLFWLALGAGILIKGPISALIAALTVITLAIADKGAAWLKQLRPLAGVPLALAVIAPWLIAITLYSGGTFIEESVGQDLLNKIWSGQARGIVPPGLHTLLGLVTFWPFSLLLLLALPALWQKRGEPAVRFCLAWALPTWIFYELIFTKLPHYVMPVFPAFALLAAMAWFGREPLAGAGAAVPRWYRRTAIALWAGATLALAALPVWLAWLDAKAAIYQDLALAIIALSAALIAVRRLMLNEAGQSAAALVICGVALSQALLGWTLPGLSQPWIAPRAMAAIEHYRPCPGKPTHIAVTGFGEPSMVFLAGTDTYRANSGVNAAIDTLHNPCALTLVEETRLPGYMSLLAGVNIVPEHLATIDGFNYNRGERVALHLFRNP